MKTFKVVFVLLSFVFLYQDTNAQLYVGAHAGYGVAFTPQIFGISQTNTVDANNQTIITQANNYGNAGPGLRAGLKPGFMFNDYFGIELGVYYFASPEILVQDTTNFDAMGVETYYKTYTQGWQLRVNPAFVFHGGDGALKPHARIGPIIPVAGSTKARREATNPLLVNPQFIILEYNDMNGDRVTADLFDLEAEFVGSFSIGLESAVGLTFDLSDNLSIFGEAFFTSLRIRRASSEVTKATATMSDGEVYDILPLLSLGGVYTHTNFVDEVNLNEIQEAMANATLNENIVLPGDRDWNPIFGAITDYGSTPDKAHTLKSSDGAYSAFGINLGLTFSFGD